MYIYIYIIFVRSEINYERRTIYVVIFRTKYTCPDRYYYVLSRVIYHRRGGPRAVGYATNFEPTRVRT